MSSARARRTFVPSSPAPAPSSAPAQANNMDTPGLTLPQVIALIDTRLVNLEVFMRETKSASTSDGESNTIPLALQNEVISEYNQRFEILAEEINTVKDLVMKLQAYTMDVNKALYEERVQIFSGMGSMSVTPEEPVDNVTITNTSFGNKTFSITENIVASLSEESEK